MRLAELLSIVKQLRNIKAVYEDLIDRLDQALSGALTIPTDTEDEDAPESALHEVRDALLGALKEVEDSLRELEEKEH